MKILGFHKWSKWMRSYESVLFRSCDRCDKMETRKICVTLKI